MHECFSKEVCPLQSSLTPTLTLLELVNPLLVDYRWRKRAASPRHLVVLSQSVKPTLLTSPKHGILGVSASTRVPLLGSVERPLEKRTFSGARSTYAPHDVRM